MVQTAADCWVSDDDQAEADMEFGQMADQLSLEVVSDFARALHVRHTRVDGTPLWGHLQAVARGARRLTEDYYRESSVAESRYWSKVAYAAGLLHEAQLRCGTSFESIAARGGPADEAVAKAVGALTPDIRVPRPQRNELLSNHIGRGGPVAQMVKLADLRHDVVLLVSLVDEGMAMIMDPVTEFCTEARFVLESLNDLNEHAWSQRVLRETRTHLVGLQDFCGCATRRVNRR
jgi:hypothetical protein